MTVDIKGLWERRCKISINLLIRVKLLWRSDSSSLVAFNGFECKSPAKPAKLANAHLTRTGHNDYLPLSQNYAKISKLTRNCFS